MLRIFQALQFECMRREEVRDFASDVLVAHLVIVCAIAKQELFIVAQEGRGIQPAFIPDKYDPAAWLQNSREFPLCLIPVKPMKRLTGSDKVNTGRFQRCGFRCRVNADKTRKSRKQ